MLKLITTSLVAIIISTTVFAQQGGSSEELKQKQNDIQREIDYLRKTLNDSKKSTTAGVRQLEIVKEKLRLREKAIKNINQQISVLEGNIDRSKSEIDSLKSRLDTMKAQYARNIVYAYQMRSNYGFLSFIFSASSFNDALRRVHYFRTYHSYCEEQAVAIKNTHKVLTGKITGLELTRREKDAVIQKQEKQKLELEEEKKEKNAVVKTLKSHEKEIAKELTSKQKLNRILGNQIQKVIQLEINRAQETEDKKTVFNSPVVTKKTSIKKEDKKSILAVTPEGIRLSGTFEKNKGKLPWPVEKALVKLHFGPNRIPGSTLITPNPGLTLATEKNAPVKAIFEGEVTAVFPVEGTMSVMIRHGKYFTVYGNLASVNITKNQKVSAGQVLGSAAGSTEGDGELEFILMLERKNIDPAKWLRKR